MLADDIAVVLISGWRIIQFTRAGQRVHRLRHSDVSEPMAVHQAVLFPKSDEARKCVEKARSKRQEIAKMLEAAIGECITSGRLVINLAC